MVTATPHEDMEAALASAEADANARLARSGHIVKDEYGPLAEGWQITVGYGHSGFGMYAHLEEYPEEGSVFFRSLDDIQRDAYAEGRKDEAEARALHFLRVLELLEKAQELAQGIWRDELKKDERDGLAFNLMSGIREFLRDANDA